MWNGRNCGTRDIFQRIKLPQKAYDKKLTTFFCKLTAKFSVTETSLEN